MAAGKVEGLRVLVVDDHADVLECACTMLTQAGAQVGSALNPFYAADIIRSHVPDVLVTDLLMPGCDGFELLRNARGAGYAGGAVAITASLAPEVETRARAAGFLEIVHKPIEPDELLAAIARAATARMANAARPRTGRFLQGVRVLLVEDHPDTQLTYAHGLRLTGADVATASTAQVALLTLQRHMPHVLVVDIALPDVDGNELLRKIRRMKPGPGWDTPAIALTAHNSSEDRMKTLNAGFRLHVPKPVDPEYLAGLVAELARV
jgi:CheY-like chemotaxis protein